MSITLFFVDAFTSALDRGMASANDIIRHVTPEVLSIHLPRNLWARLLTACLGAPRVDANTIVETIGIPNLCEHMPKPLLWTCLAEIAATALGGARASAVMNQVVPPPPAATAGTSAGTGAGANHGASGVYGATAAAAGMATTIGLASAPAAPSVPAAAAPRAMRASSPDILLPPPPASTRPPTGPIEVPEPTDAGRRATASRGLGTSRMTAGASSRRPQAGVAPTGPCPVLPTPRSAVTPTSMPAQTPRRDELDFEIETDLRADWKAGSKDAIPVDDEQLVDWSANEETSTGSSIDRNKR